MRKIIAFFVRQNLFGDLLTVAVIAFGFASLFLIRREIFPNVEFDIVTIRTVFPAASPEEVEKLVTNPIEQDLQEVDGIKKILSVSEEGLSDISIYLDPDRITAEKGKSDIQDVVDRMTDLPEDAEEPVVTSVQSKQGPIIEVSVSGDMPPLELRRVARDLETEIEAVPGVARIVHRGLRDIEIHVEADQDLLARYRLSLDDLVFALKRQNVTIPGGTIEVSSAAAQGKERIVRTVGDFSDLDDVRKTVVRANDLGRPIRVGDIAKVSYGLERAQVLTRTNGLPALSLTVLQKEKTDAIHVVDNVRKRVTEYQKNLDPRVKIDFINDYSEFIRRRLSILTGNLAIGLLFVLALLPMLIPFRFSLIIALGEPFAFLGTILLLYWWGFGINLISMIGLIIVSGILVDDSIVVTENAVRLVEEGVEPHKAAVDGTLQIMGPLTASVLTTTMAFLPMMFMSGIFGKFVREIPIAVLTALGVSLLETFIILPAHIAHWIKPVMKGQAPGTVPVNSSNDMLGSGVPRRRGNKVARVLDRATRKTQTAWDQRVVPLYLKWLRLSLRHRYFVAVGGIVFFFGSLALSATVMKFVLFPPEGVEIFFIETEVPVGTSLERHGEMLRSIETAVRKLPANELDDFTTTVGIVQQDPNDPNTRRGTEVAQVQVILSPETNRTRKAIEIIEDLRKQVGTPPGFNRVNFVRVNTGPPTGKPVSLGVRAREYKNILPVVKELKDILATIDGVTDIADSYVLGKEELRVNVNASEAAAANLSVATIGNTVRAAYEGIAATTVRELDEEIDVRVMLPRDERSTARSLTDILIPNNFGNLIPLKSVAKVTSAQGLSKYEHERNKRQVKVTAEIDTSKTSSTEVNNKIRSLLPELNQKHPGIEVGFGGEDEDTQESLASLGRAFALAITGIFLILVLTFKSLLQPLVVLLTVPLGIVAVIWAFFLHGLPLSFMGCLGIVALAGVIVNNAIVLVDFINQRRSEGVSKMDSILEAAKTRVRPIFLTTVTTVIGILPTAYGIGGQDLFVVPIAMALGWGLMFGSVLTAFVFPAALAILDDVSGFFARRLRRA